MAAFPIGSFYLTFVSLSLRKPSFLPDGCLFASMSASVSVQGGVQVAFSFAFFA